MILETFLLVSGLLLQIAKAEFRVELVQVVFRHGERTPREAESYKNDPYDLSVYEPMGQGQLTNKGKMREHMIGEMLRKEYNQFLGNIYHPSDVYAISTNVDRTKMSLQLVLAGLYPPSALQLWNKNLNWMPIPTHYMPERIDTVLKPTYSPLFQEELKKVRNSAEIIEKFGKYKEFYKFLSEKTGNNISDSIKVFERYHLLTAQKAMNLSLPEWVTNSVYKTMEDITAFEYDVRSYNTNLKRLYGGMLIKKFIENMNVDGKIKNPRKIYLYSGHETNVAAYAKAHDFKTPKVPNYGSAIIFEKLRDSSSKLFVRLRLWTGVSRELINYKLDGCDEICPFEKYLKLVRNVIPTEEEATASWKNITPKELRELYKEKISSN